MADFRRYIALGDSMSIDLYPALDVGEVDVAVALERDPLAGAVAPLGAASLFYRGNETYWPDDLGEDLSSRYPGITYLNIASDGATIGEVFGEQLPRLEATDEPTLATLTIGGNDLLSAYGGRPRRPLLEVIARDVIEAHEFLIESVRRVLSNATLIVTTVYDPSDRSGRIPGVYDDAGPLPLDILDDFNAHVRRLAAGTPQVLLADAYAHFLGHGTSAADADRWYWRRSLIEPNARGARELRTVWLDALTRAGDY